MGNEEPENEERWHRHKKNSFRFITTIAHNNTGLCACTMDEARTLAARLLCFGFDDYEVNDHAREMIALGAGSVIIFARNIQNPAQVAALCADLKRLAAPRPLIVMVDQEGGRVARLRAPHYTEVPAAGRIGCVRLQKFLFLRAIL